MGENYSSMSLGVYEISDDRKSIWYIFFKIK